MSLQRKYEAYKCRLRDNPKAQPTLWQIIKEWAKFIKDNIKEI